MKTAPSAFTLIELLVVMAIVTVLAGLMVGAMRSGRETGHAVECTNNLRSLAGANLRYAAEHEGRYCFSMEKNNNVRWHGVRRENEESFDATAGPLSPYLGKDARVKICPSFAGMLTNGASFEDGSGGYGYNAVYVGGSPANKWQGERIANITAPTRTVMFSDTALSRPTGIQEYPFSEPWQWVAPSGKLSGALSPSVHFRHGGKANVAWCDGHVTAEAPTKLGTKNYYGGDDEKNRLGWFGPSEENGYWNPNFREETR